MQNQSSIFSDTTFQYLDKYYEQFSETFITVFESNMLKTKHGKIITRLNIPLFDYFAHFNHKATLHQL